MFKILLTCPPMINRINNYKHLFDKYNFDVFCPEFSQIMTENELCKILPNYDGWIIGDDPATRKVFENGKKGKLKAAIKWGVGTDNVDFNACSDLNIPISNIPNVFGEEVSDIAIGYLLCLSRKLHTIHVGHISNKWLKPIGETLVGKKVCLIGLGDIGRCVAKKLLAFRLDIWTSDPACSKKDNIIIGNYGHGFPNMSFKDPFEEIHSIKIDSLDNCLAGANYIICCCPLNQHTYHLINKDTILKCKKGVKIINIARGGIIKETDVIELLGIGFIESVGFDVFEEEPLSMDNKLRDFQQNIFGSHNGSNTTEAVDKVSNLAIQKLNNFLTN